MNVNRVLKEFISDENGLTAVEYAIAGSLVAGAVVLAFSNLGESTGDKVDCLGDVLGDRDGARAAGCN